MQSECAQEAIFCSIEIRLAIIVLEIYFFFRMAKNKTCKKLKNKDMVSAINVAY